MSPSPWLLPVSNPAVKGNPNKEEELKKRSWRRAASGGKLKSLGERREAKETALCARGRKGGGERAPQLLRSEAATEKTTKGE